MKNLVIVLVCLIGAIIIVGLDDFGKESLGLLTLLVIDIFVAFVFFLITKYKPKMCRYTLLLLFATNILLLFNAVGWNEGSMQGSYYYVPFLKNITDVLYALMLFSAFLLMLPMILYAIFLYNVARLFCKDDKTDTLAEYFKQKEAQQK